MATILDGESGDKNGDTSVSPLGVAPVCLDRHMTRVLELPHYERAGDKAH